MKKSFTQFNADEFEDTVAEKQLILDGHGVNYGSSHGSLDKWRGPFHYGWCQLWAGCPEVYKNHSDIMTNEPKSKPLNLPAKEHGKNEQQDIKR
ncbi:60S ribosomal protein L10-like protein [Cricetulus griseus]|uniref:60S ribosomal protein L10-like protein n=1 Tax=Cricetulus griseus TaxID=10029 RepID=A0A061HWV8_CRIGR|nr:60S ribosomal protein L10-like protein [Cricetulus griseus]